MNLPVRPDAGDPSAAYECVVQSAKDKAEQLSQRLLQLAHEERESILAEARAEAQRIREEAQQEGFEAGRREKAEEVDQVLRTLNRQMAEITVQYQQFMESYGERLQDFAVEIAEKILCRQIELDETSMAALVRKAIASVKNVDWMTVELSGQMGGLVEQMKEEVLRLDRADAKRVDVAARDLPPGSCVIETPTGLVDASISVQLEKLQEYFSRP